MLRASITLKIASFDYLLLITFSPQSTSSIASVIDLRSLRASITLKITNVDCPLLITFYPQSTSPIVSVIDLRFLERSAIGFVESRKFQESVTD